MYKYYIYSVFTIDTADSVFRLDEENNFEFITIMSPEWNKDWMYDDYESDVKRLLDNNSDELIEVTEQDVEKFIKRVKK